MAAPPEKRARVEVTDLNVDNFKVVFPGEEGSLAHVATLRFMSHMAKAELCGVESFAHAFKEVAAGRALYACVPIENSASGSIAQTYDLLAEHDVVIGGELGIRESYAICGKEGTTLASIRKVLSHPNLLEACSTFIETKLDESVEASSTRSSTDAAKRAASPDEKPGAVAAICTRDSALRNGLKILASNIGNHTYMEARYILVHSTKGPAANIPVPFPRDVGSPVRKHTAVFVINDEPASLFKLIGCWALRGINVMGLETRPLKTEKAPAGMTATHLWDFLVFVDFAEPPGTTEEASQRLWGSLKEFSQWQRNIGVYPSQTSRATKKQPQDWNDMIDIMCKG